MHISKFVTFNSKNIIVYTFLEILCAGKWYDEWFIIHTVYMYDKPFAKH